jgi:hypothetical protein
MDSPTTTNLPISNVTSLVYELPFGRGRQFLGSSNAVTNTVLSGWQISAINTMSAGYSLQCGLYPELSQRGIPTDLRNLSRSE